MSRTTVQSVQFILIRTIKNYLFSQIVSLECHFENTYFPLNPIIIGLTNKGSNTCRVYGTLTVKSALLLQNIYVNIFIFRTVGALHGAAISCSLEEIPKINF